MSGYVDAIDLPMPTGKASEYPANLSRFQPTGRPAVRGLRERLAERVSHSRKHESSSKGANKPAPRSRKRAATARTFHSDQQKEGVAS